MTNPGAGREHSDEGDQNEDNRSMSFDFLTCPLHVLRISPPFLFCGFCLSFMSFSCLWIPCNLHSFHRYFLFSPFTMKTTGRLQNTGRSHDTYYPLLHPHPKPARLPNPQTRLNLPPPPQPTPNSPTPEVFTRLQWPESRCCRSEGP